MPEYTVLWEWVDDGENKHICNPSDKYCQEGANPYRHPNHDSHITGCNCVKGNGTQTVQLR